MEIERLISSDSHVGRSHDQVKAHLASKYHEAYDGATGMFAQRSATGNAGAQAANMQRYNHPARNRPGHHDPRARLEDMDIDGVDAEVLYCDVSAYRYLYKMKEGWQEGTRAFNDALVDFASVDPKRLVVSYQIPIHEIDVAVQEVERVAELGGKSLQLPVFPNELGFDDYFHRNVFLTFIEEPDAVQLLRHRLGTRNIMWSSDYPHPVSSWPNSRKIAEEQTAGMSAEDRDLVLAGNAARVWNL